MSTVEKLEGSIEQELVTRGFKPVTNEALVRYAALKTRCIRGSSCAYAISYNKSTKVYQHLLIVKYPGNVAHRTIYLTSTYDELWIDQGENFQLTVWTTNVVRCITDSVDNIFNTNLIYVIQPMCTTPKLIRWLKIYAVNTLASIGIIRP